MVRGGFRLGVIAAVALFVALGCGDDAAAPRGDAGVDGGAPATDEYEAEPFASTILLDDDALDALTEVDAEGTLHFASLPAALANVERRQVIVASKSAAAPSGLLKLVTAVQSEAGGTAVHTVDAPIQLAFRKLHVRLARSTSRDGTDLDFSPAPDVGVSVAPLWAEEKIDGYAFNGDGDPETPLDQVHFHGKLAGGFDYQYGLDVDWGDVYEIPDKVLDCLEEWVTGSFSCSVTNFIPEAKVGFGFKAGAEADLALEGVAFLGYSRELVLAKAKLDPITIGPLVFIPTVEVLADFSGDASSQFAIESHASALAEASVSYSSESGGKLTPPTLSHEFSAPSVVATLAAHSKVRVGPRLHLRLYDVLGPYASLYATAELEADQASSPCHTLYGGLEGDVGFSIASPDLPVVGRVTLADFARDFGLAREAIASGSCEAPAGGDPAAPTAGAATAKAFANPDFTPWARAYADTVDGFPYEGLGAQLEWSAASATVDGRFLLSGSDVHTLQKIEPSGALSWAKQYRATNVEFFDDTLDNVLLLGKTVATEHTTTLVLAHPYTLLTLDAAGRVLGNLHFVVPYRETWLRFTDVVADGQGGYFVAGTYGKDALDSLDCDAWLLHLDAEGHVLWSQTFGDSGTGEMIRALVALPDGVVALGARFDPADVTFRGLAARFSQDGVLAWSQLIVGDGCGDGFERSVHLTSGFRSDDGDVMVGASVEYAGYQAAVLKLKPEDGTLAFYATTMAGDTSHLGPFLTALVPLPNSGFLAAGVYSGAQTREDIWLAGLDSIGKPQWMSRYGAIDVGDDLIAQADGYPSIVLTRDGGALVLAYSEVLGGEDSLWAMKVPAKDGAFTFAAGSGAAQNDVSFQDGDACLAASAYPAAPTALAVETASFQIAAEDVSVVSPSL